MTTATKANGVEVRPDRVPTIHEAMGAVLAEIPAVGKNSQAPGNMGGYAFRGIEDVLAAVKPAMAKHGVFCTPHILDRQLSERAVSGNKTMYVVDLWIEWTFRGPAGDEVKADAWGCGTDMGDKATQKAMTSAFKSMLMQTFAIGDAASDSERHDVPETERPTVNPETPFTSIGWKDRAEQDAWRAHYTAEARKLTEEQRKEFKADAEALGLVWREPIPKSVADDVDKLIAEYQQEATSPASAPQEAQTEPSKCLGCGHASHDCRCQGEPF